MSAARRGFPARTRPIRVGDPAAALRVRERRLGIIGLCSARFGRISPTSTLSAYFSHSWKPAHLPLNLAVWERLSKRCHLLIDQPVQTIRETSPPWYINRIEALLRRSDVFVACMPPTDRAPNETLGGDWRLRCSPYLLFEIRMAERADLPRFIVYDRESRFQPGPRRGRTPGISPAASASCPHGLSKTTSTERSAISSTSGLLGWSATSPLAMSPTIFNGGSRGPPPRRETVRELVRESVSALDLEAPVDPTEGMRRDSELSELLRSLSFLVVDVSDAALLPMYNFAHALMVPCIRLHEVDDGKSDVHLPSILRGHPAGYQLDTIDLNAGEVPIAEGITRRATADIQGATAIRDLDKGRYELQQRGYKRHLVFISHDSRPAARALVNEIGAVCARLGIDFWEYETKNLSGDHWRNNLDQALAAMTHFVLLLSDTYEQSKTCRMELDRALARATEVVALPFLLNGRARPNVDLVRIKPEVHHQRISSERPVESAAKVVENILLSIRR